MLWLMRKKFQDSPTYAVTVDTGIEHTAPDSAAD
jgi:3'-phosphoadenosine 5'-phosphosulfate sulfotransferase (PAPS reductase)/FAD synthetase